MAPKNKFTKEEMLEAALRVVREKGMEGLSAKSMASALGTSTQPVFTAFGSMAGIKQAVYDAAVRVYDSYTEKGLREQIPFFGVGIQYIRFAREEPALYRLLFLTQKQDPFPMARWDAMLLCRKGVRRTLGSHLSHHTGGSRRLFPRSVARGPQSCHPDCHRRLPLL